MDELRWKLNRFLALCTYYFKLGYNWVIWFVLTKWISMFAFWIIGFVDKWNQEYFDKNIVYLYQRSKKKKAFEFKVKVLNMGKGNRNVKLVMIETETGVIDIKLSKEKEPHLFGK